MVLKHSLDEILTVKKVFELLEVNRVLGCLAFECINQCLQLMMRVDSTFLNVVEQFVLEEETTVVTVECFEGTACPGSGRSLSTWCDGTFWSWCI